MPSLSLSLYLSIHMCVCVCKLGIELMALDNCQFIFNAPDQRIGKELSVTKHRLHYSDKSYVAQSAGAAEYTDCISADS